MIHQNRRGIFNRQYRVFLLCLLFGVIAIVSYANQMPAKVPDGDVDYRYFTIVSTVTYENRNTHGVSWQLTKDEKELGLFMNNSWQTVYLLNASYSVNSFEVDEDDNSVAFIEFPQSAIQPGENLTFTIFYKVALKPRLLSGISVNASESLAEIPQSLIATYCRAGGSWQPNNSAISALAAEIAADKTNVLEILLDFVAWIKQNIVYGTLDVPRYPNETFLQHTGDCDDQANLLISLCRAAGIPAYLQVGCIYMPGTHATSSYWNGQWISTLTRIGWHGWAMVYVPPWGWLPVDLTYAPGNELDPLNSIINSAIIIQPTAQYCNITVTDYVLSSRAWRDFIISEEFYIQTHDTMIDDSSMEQNSQQFSGVQIKFSVLLIRMTCLPSCWLNIISSFCSNYWFSA